MSLKFCAIILVATCNFYFIPRKQRKNCGSRERACANNHHDLLLENQLSSYKVLNISIPTKPKQPKETNWKQKFQKPKNENICLTYLDAENNGNFHFLSLEGYDYLRICGLKMEHITYTISQYL